MHRLAAAAAALACLAAGCGDEEEPGRTATFDSGGAVRIAGSEYEFDPSTAVVPAGRVRIELANEGSLAHNLHVFDGERRLARTPSFPAGRTEGVTLRLRPGEYRMVCTVGDHEDLGMTGTLRVR